MQTSIFKKNTLRILAVVLALVFIPFPGSVSNPKIAKGECSEVWAQSSVSFDYIRNGHVQSYFGSASSNSNVDDSVTVDAGSTLSNISFRIQSILGPGYANIPNHGFFQTDTNNNPQPVGPYASDPINFSSYMQSISVTATQGCNGEDATVFVVLDPRLPDPTFGCTVSQSTATVDPGTNTTYSVNTVPNYGFNNPVTFTASFSPSTATPPTVGTITNNAQVPPTTLAAKIDTTRFTTAGTYIVTFTGTGGGVTNSCTTQLIVNNVNPDFELVLSPSSTVHPNGIGQNTNPNRSNVGTDVVFDVFANCIGAFNGPITNIIATTTFIGPNLTLGATSLACGDTTTLTVTNTGSTPVDQLSKLPLPINSESINVSGLGQL